MTDQELLEYAAKAVGVALTPMLVKPLPPRTDDGFIGYMTKAEEWPSGWFNPLLSDADAFRLMVKLGFLVDIETPCGVASIGSISEEFQWDDTEAACAAVRRLVVRAAAWIGKQRIGLEEETLDSR